MSRNLIVMLVLLPPMLLLGCASNRTVSGGMGTVTALERAEPGQGPSVRVYMPKARDSSLAKSWPEAFSSVMTDAPLGLAVMGDPLLGGLALGGKAFVDLTRSFRAEYVDVPTFDIDGLARSVSIQRIEIGDTTTLEGVSIELQDGWTALELPEANAAPAEPQP